MLYYGFFDLNYLVIAPDFEQQNSCATKAAHEVLRDSWKYGEPLCNVRLPYAPLLWELAIVSRGRNLDGLKVSRTWFGNKIRLRGKHQEIKGVLDMYLATQLGSGKIA